MFKYRWFDVFFQMPLAELTKLLMLRPFIHNGDDTDGFRVESFKDNILRAQHIELQNTVESINLPTGQHIEQTIEKIAVTDFSISQRDRLGLQITNPSRRTLPFFNALSDVCEGDFYVSEAEVDIQRWIECIEEKIGSLEILYMDFSGISLSNKAKARLAVAGTSDIRTEANKFLSGHNGVIERARGVVKSNAKIGTIEISRGGWAKLNLAPEDHIVDQIKKALELSTKIRTNN